MERPAGTQEISQGRSPWKPIKTKSCVPQGRRNPNREAPNPQSEAPNPLSEFMSFGYPDSCSGSRIPQSNVPQGPRKLARDEVPGSSSKASHASRRDAGIRTEKRPIPSSAFHSPL